MTHGSAQTLAHIIAGDREAIAIAEDLAARFADGASDCDRDRRLPWAEIDKFSQSGLWSMNVPKAYGGPQLSYATIARVFAIIAAGDASIAQIAQNQINLVDIIRFDPDESHKRFLLGEALRGARFGHAQAERGGKNVHPRLTASGDGFEISGTTHDFAGALSAHFVAVSALTSDGKTVIAFSDRDAPGLEIIDDWSGIGQRTTVTLDKVQVTADRVVPAYLAFDMPSVHGAIAQIPHAAIELGIAHAAIEETIAFVRTKAHPWADSGRDKASDDPFTIREIADLKVKLHVAESVLARAGRIIDQGLKNETPESAAEGLIAVAEAKVLTTEVAISATNKLFELTGTRSALSALSLDRHWRDTRIHTLHDPVRWKFHAIGDYFVNGTKPPRHPWL